MSLSDNRSTRTLLMVIKRMGDGLYKIVKSTVTPVEETTRGRESSTSSALGSMLSDNRSTRTLLMVIKRMGDGLSKIVKSTVTPVEETTRGSESSTSSALGSMLSDNRSTRTLPMVIKRMGDGLYKIVKPTVTPVEETTSGNKPSTSSALGSNLSGLAQKTTLDSKTPQASLYSREISLPINTGTKRTLSSTNSLPPIKKFKLLTAHPVKIDEDWYGDQIINNYFKLIRNEHVNVATFDTFFFPALCCGGYEKVRRWTKKVDVFSYDLILIPVNENEHWRLVEVKPKEKTITLYDSLNKADEVCLDVMMDYLQNESLDKRGTPLVEPWTIQLGVSPQQYNGYDCGVFVCESARRLAAGHTLSYYQHMAQTIRIRIKNEIEAGTLQ